jgi:hypothetical protein
MNQRGQYGSGGGQLRNGRGEYGVLARARSEVAVAVAERDGMTERGQYGQRRTPAAPHAGPASTHVGAFLVHTLELKQRFNNAKNAAVQALLNDLASHGVARSVGPNRWEIALKDGAWVMFTWYPDWSALEVTIADRELRAVDQMDAVRRRYEEILQHKIIPRLQRYGATTVGAAIYAGQSPTNSRFDARTRAIRAVFDMYSRSRAPYYIYAEVNGRIDRRSSSSLDEANAIYFALERALGDVYVAIFDPTDALWPGPAADSYHAAPQDRPIVGQGSIIPHLPGEVEDELKQLHGEIMAFGQELIEQIKPLEEQAKVRVQKARDEETAAWKIAESFQPLVNEVYRIEKLLNEAGVSAKTTNAWREQSPPYDNIRFAPMLYKKAEDLKKQFIAAKEALDKFMPEAKRLEAIKNAREASSRRSMQEAEQLGEFPLVKWSRMVWRPFFDGWNAFYHEKIDIPMQTLPGSGTWDRIQEYRRQFIDLRNKAPFKAQGPASLDPSGRTDPSLTGGLRAIWEGAGNVFGIVKWGLIGALGIGAVVALSSVVSNVRKGKDPAEKYVDLIRESRRTRAARALPAPRKQLALPAGESA